jgi:hypothetical protein
MILGDTTSANGTAVMQMQQQMQQSQSSSSSVGTSTSAAGSQQQNGNGAWPPVTTRVFMRTRRAAMNEALALAAQGSQSSGGQSSVASTSSVVVGGSMTANAKLPHSGSTGSLASTLTGPAAAAGQRRYSTRLPVIDHSCYPNGVSS